MDQPNQPDQFGTMHEDVESLEKMFIELEQQDSKLTGTATQPDPPASFVIDYLAAAADQRLHELPDVLDLRDVADLLRVHQKTVRLMAIEKKIPAFRAGRLWRFKKTKIEEWLNANAGV